MSSRRIGFESHGLSAFVNALFFRDRDSGRLAFPDVAQLDFPEAQKDGGDDLTDYAGEVQPPFSPMNSTQFRSSRPFRQKQIPSSPKENPSDPIRLPELYEPITETWHSSDRLQRSKGKKTHTHEQKGIY